MVHRLLVLVYGSPFCRKKEVHFNAIFQLTRIYQEKSYQGFHRERWLRVDRYHIYNLIAQTMKAK